LLACFNACLFVRVGSAVVLQNKKKKKKKKKHNTTNNNNSVALWWQVFGGELQKNISKFGSNLS
jgi:hypothetical protein